MADRDDGRRLFLSARQPAGMSPSGLALSADQTELLIACSDANVVAVADARRDADAR